MKRKWPSLEPLWMERQSLIAHLESMFGPTPSIGRARRELEEVELAIANGELPWPPVGAYTNEGELIERYHRLPPKLTANDIRCFAETPYVQRYMAGIRALSLPLHTGYDYEQLTLHQLFHYAMWASYGRRVYVIDEHTFELLMNTDLPEFPGRFLHVPAQSFYVRFPTNALHFNLALDPNPQPVEGALVSFNTAMGQEEEDWREMNVLVVGKSPLDPVDDNCFYLDIPVHPDEPISRIAEPKAAELVTVGGEEIGYKIPQAIVGLCLYLMSEHPSLVAVEPTPKKDLTKIKNPAKRKKAEAQNARISSLGYFYVGRPDEGRAGQTAAVASGTDGRKLDRPVWVRGHYRLQPHGPKRSQRKVIWIHPHTRGPDFADALEASRPARVWPAKKRD